MLISWESSSEEGFKYVFLKAFNKDSNQSILARVKLMPFISGYLQNLEC